MKKPLLTLLGAVILACTAVAANADELSEKMYFEVDYMRLDMEANIKEAGAPALDANPSALGFKLGTQFNKYFGIEGLIAIGIADDEFISVEGNSINGELKTLIGVNALAIYPAAENVKIYGKLGFAQMDLEFGAQLGNGASDSVSYDDTGLLYGIGLAIGFSRYSALTLEYIILPDVDIKEEGTTFATVETTSINIGYKYSF